MRATGRVIVPALILSLLLLCIFLLFSREAMRGGGETARLTPVSQENENTSTNVKGQRQSPYCKESEEIDQLLLLEDLKKKLSDRLSDFPVDGGKGLVFDENHMISYRAYSMEPLYQLAKNGDPYAHFEIAKRLTPDLWAVEGQQERTNEYRELFQKISFHYENMFNFGLNVASQRLGNFYRQCAESTFCQQVVMDRETSIQNYFKWTVIYDNADRAQLIFSDGELENGYEVSNFFINKTWLSSGDVNPFFIERRVRDSLLSEVDKTLLIASQKRNEVGLPSILTSKKLMDISAKIHSDIDRICDDR
ncbi:hypothetical protein [Permianibacter aggregans]|uniref:Uncharacterized protein n=1 Tax=Permianibacter aggregans TaxID=1510150 RepID=A0A4R6UZP2_9GAMM|nr:hypothetical protein [Permianibacter aggregans]QGX39994.1 hypothetical protein E2H98_10100 [Permianibacter aggregans]TDQ49194.1 hypothetical protein EV696_105168 [Permianibacter aggregans]